MKTKKVMAVSLCSALLILSCVSAPGTESYLVSDGVLQYYLPSMESSAQGYDLDFDITYRDTKSDEAQAILNFSLFYPATTSSRITAVDLESCSGVHLGPFVPKLFYRESERHVARYSISIPRSQFLLLVREGFLSVTATRDDGTHLLFPVEKPFERRISSIREDVLN